MTDKCPNCGEILTKNERLRKYYCSSCGYQIKFDSIKVDDIPKKEMEKIEESKIENTPLKMEKFIVKPVVKIMS